MMSDQWIPTGGITLEPHALEAVRELERNVAVAAGPGSGKTELLAQRADFLLQTGACPVGRRIVAISFKVDAARNLRERVSERCGPNAARRFDSFTFHAFARQLITRHRPHVAHRVPKDFRVGPGKSPTQLHYNELLPLAHLVLDRDARAARILRQGYAFAFFDEFQDCTPDQYELIRRLFADSDVQTTAVGDAKQRIMGWADALPHALSDYVSDFHARELPIYLNHRSAPRLRRVQNAVVQVMDASAALPPNELLTPDGCRGPASDGEVLVARFADAELEAYEIARQIVCDVEAGTKPANIAILAARNPTAHCERLRELLSRHQVPVRDEKDAQDAFAEPVGELILDCARVLVLSHAPDEYLRLSSFMTRNCVDERQAARRRSKLDEFLERKRVALSGGSVHVDDPVAFSDILYEFLRLCERQFLSRLSLEYADDRQLTYTAGQAVDAINGVISTSTSSTSAMARLSHLDAVRLMTVHKSKGLEFDNVYFVAIEDEVFFGKPLDERATFFVGISRARSKLVLTCADRRPKPTHPPARWSVARTPQAEFLGYALPFANPTR